MHAKYMMIDNGKKTSISSVNFSYTSFMLNREAGLILEGTCSGAIAFYKKVFEGDWAKAVTYKPTNSYSNGDMNTITDTSPYSVNIPTPRNIPSAYVTNFLPVEGITVKKVFAAPDYAREELESETLDKVTKMFYLTVYQVSTIPLI